MVQERDLPAVAAIESPKPNVVHEPQVSAVAIDFERLIPDPTNRGTVISTFLALLELCKRQVVQVRQSEVFDEIVVELRSSDVDASALTSEYDIGAAMADQATKAQAIANG
jgi:chromatin segregation and condensation protein Rec8/ScpA/Scc1 (kleisin family)